MSDMWIMNKDGFFSVVQDVFCEPGFLVIRARVKDDLVRLLKRAESNVNLFKFEEADYRYRVYLLREVVMKYVADTVEIIDYPNFKKEVHDQGKDRAYMGCWSSLHILQDE